MGDSGSEWGFNPRVLALPQFTEEAVFSLGSLQVLFRTSRCSTVGEAGGRGGVSGEGQDEKPDFPLWVSGAQKLEGASSVTQGLLQHLCHCSPPGMPAPGLTSSSPKSAPRSKGGT